MGRSAGPRRTETARRQRVSAALPGTDSGPGALGRRLRRLRGGGNLSPGARCGRVDRGRLRAAARDRIDRGGERRWGAAGVGWLLRQYRLRATVRRQGRDRGGLRQGRPRGQAPLRDQPRHRRQHGAARLPRRLQRRGRPLHPLYDVAARASLPRRAFARAQGAGEQDPRGCRRHRRQLRHEVGGVQRGRARSPGVEKSWGGR